MFFHAASGIVQIKKFCIQEFGRGICLKSTFLNKSTSLRLVHWWLIINHYKLVHFCFLSYLYWEKLLLYPVRKDLSLASWDSQFFSLFTKWMIRLLLFGGDIHPNSRPQTHKWVCDICHNTKHWVHLKCSQITTKDYNNS